MAKRTSRRSDRRAFTLIEIMSVIIVLGMIMGLAVQALVRHRSHLNTGVEQALARSHALEATEALAADIRAARRATAGGPGLVLELPEEPRVVWTLSKQTLRRNSPGRQRVFRVGAAVFRTSVEATAGGGTYVRATLLLGRKDGRGPDTLMVGVALRVGRDLP